MGGRPQDPLPGAEVKLVPAEGAHEIRVKGPNVTPGYFARPDLTAAAFDADGFYQTGDAVALADPQDPNAGPTRRLPASSRRPERLTTSLTPPGT